MATAAEQTFINAVTTAEGIRQVAKSAAFATFQAAGFTPAAYATYAAALTTADVAYMTSVNSAATTLSLCGYTTPNSGPSQANVTPGSVGHSSISALGTFGDGNTTMGSIG